MGRNRLLYTKSKDNKPRQYKHLLKKKTPKLQNTILLFSDYIYKVYKGESYKIIHIILI